MAGFYYDQNTDGDRPNDGSNSGKTLSFREMMAAVFGQNVDDCGFPIPGLPVNGAEWLDKFQKDKKCKTPESDADVLICTLPIASGPFGGIKVSKNKIESVLEGKPEEKILKAFAMATIAAGNQKMLTHGVNVNGDSPEEKLFMFIAASYLGLKVLNSEPEIEKQAQAYRQSTDNLWKTFVQEMENLQAPQADQKNDNEPPQSTPPSDQSASPASKGNSGHAHGVSEKNKNDKGSSLNPDLLAALKKTLGAEYDFPNARDKDAEKFWDNLDAKSKREILHENNLGHLEQEIMGDAPDYKPTPTVPESKPSQKKPERLTSVFNRQLPDNVKTILAGSDSSEAAYHAFTRAVIKGQDARGTTLRDLKNQLKDEFGLTNDNVKDIVRAMDTEGLTSCKPGHAREVHFNPQGQPKAPSAA